MHTRTKRFQKFASAALALALAAGTAGAALAADVKLSNGGVWKGDVGARVRVTYMLSGREVVAEGTVVKADKNLLVFEVEEGGKASKRTVTSFDLKKIETLGGSAPATPPSRGATPAAPGSGATASAGAPAADASGATRIFLMPWSGTVGIGARHEEIEQIGKIADKFGPGQIIVLQVDSPGGLVIEGDKIHETLKDLKQRHRVVAWIKKAISAAAFTSLHCDEIYFMRCGALGAITMFSGQTAISGKELDAWLDKVGEACEIGGRSPWIGHAMVTNAPLLSYDKDENGKVTWYNTLQGKHRLSDEKENLTMNADNSADSGFSDGTADTVEELMACMQIKSYQVMPEGKQIHDSWHASLERCLAEKPLLMNDLNNPGGSDPVAQIGNQIKALQELLKWYDKCYPCVVYEAPNLPPDPAPLKEQLERLRKQLAQMKKRQNG